MLLSGPICPDPDPNTFKKNRPRGGSLSARLDYDIKPRVTAEAKSIADMHKGSIGLIFGLQPSEIKTGWKPEPSKDHMKDNIKRMREIQRTARLKQEEKERSKNVPVKVLPQSAKYTTVPSKVTLELQNLNTPRPEATHYLRAHSRTGGKSARSPSPDYVVHNKSAVVNVAETLRTAYQKKEQQMQKKEHFESFVQSRKGLVPGYLRSRQKQWEQDQERRLRSTPDPDMPPGHRQLSEAERQETLATLKQNLKSTHDQLVMLPITPDTLRLKQRRMELDLRLSQLEEAIRVFERPKVFVKLDEKLPA